MFSMLIDKEDEHASSAFKFATVSMRKTSLEAALNRLVDDQYIRE
jgi:hypothetical protein